MPQVIKSVSLGHAHAAKLRARVAAAKAAGRTSNFSEEICRAVDEADGNHSAVRHAIRNHVNAIGLHVQLLRRGFHAGRDTESLNAIADAVAKINAAVGTAPAPSLTHPDMSPPPATSGHRSETPSAGESSGRRR